MSTLFSIFVFFVLFGAMFCVPVLGTMLFMRHRDRRLRDVLAEIKRVYKLRGRVRHSSSVASRGGRSASIKIYEEGLLCRSTCFQQTFGAGMRNGPESARSPSPGRFDDC